jgi:hypothetical protein
MSYSISAIADADFPTQAHPARSVTDWQAYAIDAYRQAQSQALTALPKLLATRVAALIGMPIDPADVLMDRDAELAVVIVDGVMFRAHHQQIMIVRSCVECGIRRFESAPLAAYADLGYALSAWQPRCRTCQPEDPADSE